MGMTSCAMHVLRAGKSMDELENVLTAIMKAEGYVPAPSAQPAEHTYYLICPQQGRWITLWKDDEMSQSPWLRDLMPAVRQLAKAADATVLAMEAVDSDICVCVLCSPGKAEDLVVRGFADDYDCEPDEGQGDAALWQDVFGLSDSERRRLEQIWQMDCVCEEERHFDMAEMLGIHFEQLFPCPDQCEFPSDFDVRRLCFSEERSRGKVIQFPGRNV